jgi:polysaccharide biosynthesis protein PslE
MPAPLRSDPTIFHITARDLLQVVFKRKLSFLLVTLATFVAGAFWIFFIRDDTYQVSAKLMVRIGHEQASTASVSGPPIMITGERMQDVNTEADILASTDLIARVVDHFKLYGPDQREARPDGLIKGLKHDIRWWLRDLREWRDEQLIRFGLRERIDRREMIINLFRAALDVHSEKNSNVVTATLNVPARKDASRLLNTLLDFYQVFRLDLYRDNGTKEFFRTEAGGAGAQLRQAEDELKILEETSNISALEKQKELLLSEISTLEREAKQAAIEAQETQEKVNRVRSEMQAKDPNFASLGAFAANSFPDHLLQQLAALDREREVLRMTEMDSSTRIRNNRSQFQVILGMIATNLRSVAAERQSVYEARLRDLAARRAELNALQEKQTTWTALKRKVRILEENYLINRRKLDESAASVAMEKQKISNVAVVQHAVDPIEPLGISKVKLLGLAMFVALIAALSWIAIAEFFDHAVYTPEALEQRLGLRVLGVVPVGKVPRWSQPGRYAHGD